MLIEAINGPCVRSVAFLRHPVLTHEVIGWLLSGAG